MFLNEQNIFVVVIIYGYHIEKSGELLLPVSTQSISDVNSILQDSNTISKYWNIKGTIIANKVYDLSLCQSWLKS